MTQSNIRLSWKILLLIGLSFVIFAGFSQWQRYQTEQKYQLLAQQRNEDSTEEIIKVENAITTGDGQGEEAGYVFQYQENPNLEWMRINPDFMGWITIDNTNINYPYVRSMDNVDYLERDFYRQKSVSGAIFMDYRNLGNFNDSHTILYGHNMKSQTMFHQLNKYQDKEFFDENPLIRISGLYESKTYKVFSVYEVSANEYTFKLNFQDPVVEYKEYLETLSALSLHPSDQRPDATRKLLTLATCSYGVDNGRLVVHAMEM